jgi:hypothetical protein
LHVARPRSDGKWPVAKPEQVCPPLLHLVKQLWSTLSVHVAGQPKVHGKGDAASSAGGGVKFHVPVGLRPRQGHHHAASILSDLHSYYGQANNIAANALLFASFEATWLDQ